MSLHLREDRWIGDIRQRDWVVNKKEKPSIGKGTPERSMNRDERRERGGWDSNPRVLANKGLALRRVRPCLTLSFAMPGLATPARVELGKSLYVY